MRPLVPLLALGLFCSFPAFAGKADAKISAATKAFQQGDFQQAATLFKQALALDKRNVLVWHFYGQALAKTGDNLGARRAWEQAIELEPDSKAGQRSQEMLDKLPLSALPAFREPEMVRIPNNNYEIGKYEVTQGQWKAVMGSNPSSFKDCGDTCPVEQVSWNDIQKFLQKLNTRTGKNYRFPTESEWQTACLAGSQTEYCGGNDLNAVAWYSDNSGRTTHPVGQKQPNAYGLYDMSGNVWEWMQDKWDNEHDWRVLRGGSWGYTTPGLRAAIRLNDYFPSERSNNIGFRLARTLP